jgi:group I intron endonuclease
VPTPKGFKFKGNPIKNKFYKNIRTFSTLPKKDDKFIPAKVYEDAESMRKVIIKENKGKSGIYMFTNKITGDTYVGQSINLSNRFKHYFSISYLQSKDGLRISRAILKYGYSNFSITIVEYCNVSNLLEREQYYFHKFEPQYNILKIAGSSLGFNHSEETKAKISKSLKGIYVNEKSALFGRSHEEETKVLMSLKKAGVNNPLFGKIHSENTKNLMREKALGRKHSIETKLKMSSVSGNMVNIYEKCSSEGFMLIGTFVSARRAANFLNMSGTTVIKYMNSGAIYKDRYKFSSK